MSEPLLSALCPYCNASPPKYRCPACSARTCSLACSKKHKVYNQCSGVRNPAAFVRRSALLSSPTTLNQDYNYLSGVERAITRGPLLTVDQPKLVLEGEEEDVDAAQTSTDRQKLAKQLESTRGVIVRQAPAGMKRARENRTAFVGGRRKRKTVRWTVEWLVYDLDSSRNNNSSGSHEPTRLLSARVPENTPISEAFSNQLQSISTSAPSFNGQTEANPLYTPDKASRRRFTASSRFYLRKADVPANRPTLIELSPEQSLAEALRGEVLLEFPTIVVGGGESGGSLGGFGECEVIKKPRKVSESGGEKAAKAAVHANSDEAEEEEEESSSQSSDENDEDGSTDEEGMDGTEESESEETLSGAEVAATAAAEAQVEGNVTIS
ncbi:hypothetical protein BDZ91DRAFT_790065 [Kalaharituber pfeilii]|nr:hypothetical protein BDZ91DRAFT_790065 [Kalaharituber pfeilii]